jgi:hypothetical protein
MLYVPGGTTRIEEEEEEEEEEIFLSERHHQIMTYIVTSFTSFCFQHLIGTKIAVPEVPLNIWDIFFRKVACSRYDVRTEMY